MRIEFECLSCIHIQLHIRPRYPIDCYPRNPLEYLLDNRKSSRLHVPIIRSTFRNSTYRPAMCMNSYDFGLLTFNLRVNLGMFPKILTLIEAHIFSES